MLTSILRCDLIRNEIQDNQYKLLTLILNLDGNFTNVYAPILVRVITLTHVIFCDVTPATKWG